MYFGLIAWRELGRPKHNDALPRHVHARIRPVWRGEVCALDGHVDRREGCSGDGWWRDHRHDRDQ